MCHFLFSSWERNDAIYCNSCLALRLESVRTLDLSQNHWIVRIHLRTVWLHLLRSYEVVREYAYAVFGNFLCNGPPQPPKYEVPVRHLLRLPTTLMRFCLQPSRCICKILKQFTRRNAPLKPVGESLLSYLVIFIHIVQYLLPFLLPCSLLLPIVLFVLSPSSFLIVIGIWDVTKISGSFCRH
jgi:hypothetical protein